MLTSRHRRLHLVPPIVAMTRNVRAGCEAQDVLTVVVAEMLYFLTPSTHTSMWAMVPVTFADACILP